MFAIGDILDQYLSRKKKLKRLYLVMLHYPEIVGEIIAHNTRIISIQDGRLVIGCRNSVWKRELEVYKDKILEKVQSYLPQEKIIEIVLVIGNVTVVQKKKKKKAVQLGDEDELWIKQIVEKTHPAYQTGFERVIRSYKERQQS